MRELVEHENGKRKVVGIENVGGLEGYVYLTSELSMYQQINAPRTKRDRHVHMVVSVDEISKLPAGIHDHFLISLEWRQFVLNTKILSKQGNMPVTIEEELLFPLHQVELSDSISNWRQSSLSFVVYDCPNKKDHCRSYIGGFEIDMNEIIHANIDPQYNKRVLKKSCPLFYLGQKTTCTLRFSCWFEPGKYFIFLKQFSFIFIKFSLCYG